jgi:hypothetical protein
MLNRVMFFDPYAGEMVCKVCGHSHIVGENPKLTKYDYRCINGCKLPKKPQYDPDFYYMEYYLEYLHDKKEDDSEITLKLSYIEFCIFRYVLEKEIYRNKLYCNELNAKPYLTTYEAGEKEYMAKRIAKMEELLDKFIIV